MDKYFNSGTIEPMSEHFSFLCHHMDVLALGDTKIQNSNINLGEVPNFVTFDSMISFVKHLFQVTFFDTL